MLTIAQPGDFRRVMATYFHQRDDERKETHCLMDGGKLVVPYDDEGAFLQQYANFVAQGGRAFVMCRRSFPVFRLYFDIDAHVLEPPEAAWAERIGKYVLAVVSELLEPEAVDEGAPPPPPPEVIVCETDAKQTEKGGVQCMKVGMHVHVPEVHVTRRSRCTAARRSCRSSPTTWGRGRARRADHVGGRRRRERLPRGHRPADALLAQDGGVRRVPQPRGATAAPPARRGPRRRGARLPADVPARADYARRALDGGGVPDGRCSRPPRSAPTGARPPTGCATRRRRGSSCRPGCSRPRPGAPPSGGGGRPAAPRARRI